MPILMLPQPHDVHIHCVLLDTKMAQYVSPDELIRAKQLLDPSKQSIFLASHNQLRVILGSYLARQPQELRFQLGEHGKPYLQSVDVKLHFNLSHSGNLFLLAIAVDREVGIDVEEIHDNLPFSDMARLAFSPSEQKELFSLPTHLQKNAFYRCWTRKEAYLKARGTGFTLSSNSFDVSLRSENIVGVINPNDLSHWHLHDVTVPNNFCATLAVSGSKPHIRYI